jgi:amidase
MAARSSLSRRQVLQYGAMGGALLATGVTTGGAVAVAKQKPSKPQSNDFEEATISELRKLMQSHKLSATELTRWYLDRIDALNGDSPGSPTDRGLHAVIETNPDALAIALRRDAERFVNHKGGALHGIPVIVKDNIATDDRMQTTAGSLALVGSKVPADSPLVARLRDAGAVIIGKANLSEWANFRGIAPFNGWSARGGFTRNPYVLDLDPCGSSSGTASAVATNLATAGVGTETDGSITCPAGEQSLVGIKPTVGLVAQQGIIPIAFSQDTAGPMTRTVMDAAILLNVLRTPFGSVAGRPLPDDYTDFVGRKSIKKLRLLIDTNYTEVFGTDAAVQAVFDEKVEDLRRAGATIDAVRLDDPSAPINGMSPFDAELLVLEYEMKVAMANYLAPVRNTTMRTLSDLRQFNVEHCEEEMKYFGQEWFDASDATTGLQTAEYQQAIATSQGFGRRLIDGVLAQGYDAILTPSYSFGTTTPAIAGYASMAVPVGFTDADRPVGFWLAAGFLHEPQLIAIASAIESFFEARHAPRLLGDVPPEPPDAGLCTAPIAASSRATADSMPSAADFKGRHAGHHSM